MGRRPNHTGRNSPQFVMLRYDMMDSPAWRSLSATAQALWCHIRRRYNGQNNGDIGLSCREAAALLNISKGTASRIFDELMDKGFIKVGQDSDFRLKLKKSRRWIMTHESFGNNGPTNEWRAWGKKNPSDAIS